MSTTYQAARELAAEIAAHRSGLAADRAKLAEMAPAVDDMLTRLRTHDAAAAAMLERLSGMQGIADAVVAAVKPPAPVTRSGMPWLWGIREPANGYEIMTKAGGKYDQLEAWLRRRCDLIPCFLGKELFNAGWDKLATNYVLGGTKDEPKGQLAGIYARGSIPLLAVPVMITAQARRYDLGAKGEWDEPHRAMAGRVGQIAEGGGLFLRLGWEVNEGYPWSWIEAAAGSEIPDDATWQGYYQDTFRRLVDIWRAAVPSLTVCWNHLRNTRRNVGRYFPGNSHVDVVTMDPYENGASGHLLSDEDWKRFGGSCADDSFTGPVGMLAWAEQHGLKVGFDEWGCVNRAGRNPSGKDLDPASPTNNGFYVRMMAALFNQALDRRLMSHECYFQNGIKGTHQIWPETPWNANVREAYLDLYRPKAGAAA